MNSHILRSPPVFPVRSLFHRGTAFRFHVDDIIGSLYNIQIMLDNNYGISTVTKSAKNIHQTMNIGEMKSGRRFIQNVDRLSGSTSGKLPSQASLSVPLRRIM